jgi:hypothetical protein
MIIAKAEVIGNEIEVPQVPTGVSTIEPTPTFLPETVITPEPTITPDITMIPSPEPTLTPPTEPTVTPEPTITPTLVPTVTATPTQAPPKFLSPTLNRMFTYDYLHKSITGLSTRKLSLTALQNLVKPYGKLYGTGMPYKEYQDAMKYQWLDVTEYGKKPSKINVDITKTMDYNSYVQTLKQLSRYEGVYVYKIGKSTQGRDLYAVEIDMKSDVKKNVFMLTGQIHAREFAGGTYIVKQFVDLVQKAQTDKKTMELLKKNKFVAVPIINVDGREALIKESYKWTTRGGELWKAYTNGTDGNRNFPGLQWGQVATGNRLKSIIESKPGYANYPGNYAGSNNETKAMIKWMYHYVVVEQAVMYLDLHQQGSIIYAGKGWQTKQQEQNSLNLRTKVLTHMNKGITRRKYNKVGDGVDYGLQGEGSSLTDYAVSLNIGARFSPAYGFSAFSDTKNEYMLMEIKDLDKRRVKLPEANKTFAALTVEIGYGRNYLGNSPNTRSLLSNEYKSYNFDKLLEALPGMMK